MVITAAIKAFLNKYSPLEGLGTILSDLEATIPAGGSGDVVGPAGATDNAIARFDGVTGLLLQDSGATLDNNGDLTANVLNSASSVYAGNEIQSGADGFRSRNVEDDDDLQVVTIAANDEIKYGRPGANISTKVDPTPASSFVNIAAGAGAGSIGVLGKVQAAGLGDGSTGDGPGRARFSDVDDWGGVTIKGPKAGSAAEATYWLPAVDGTPGQVLSTDGSGNLSWVDKN